MTIMVPSPAAHHQDTWATIHLILVLDVPQTALSFVRYLLLARPRNSEPRTLGLQPPLPKLLFQLHYCHAPKIQVCWGSLKRWTSKTRTFPTTARLDPRRSTDGFRIRGSRFFLLLLLLLLLVCSSSSSSSSSVLLAGTVAFLLRIALQHHA